MFISIVSLMISLKLAGRLNTQRFKPKINEIRPFKWEPEPPLWQMKKTEVDVIINDK